MTAVQAVEPVEAVSVMAAVKGGVTVLLVRQDGIRAAVELGHRAAEVVAQLDACLARDASVASLCSRADVCYQAVVGRAGVEGCSFETSIALRSSAPRFVWLAVSISAQPWIVVIVVDD